MVNIMLNERLSGVLHILNATHISGNHNPSAVKGEARSQFIKNYLNSVIPQGLRISTSGVIIDNKNNSTGELDIIIENGFTPNIPHVSIDSARLFFAEGVAAVIEVKSNLTGQWNEAISTGNKLHSVSRTFLNSSISSANSATVIMTNAKINNPALKPIPLPPQNRILNKIPYFIVGYTGWEKIETLQTKLNESNGVVSGILQLDKGFFVSGGGFKSITIQGASSLLAFINVIYESYSYIKSTNADLLSYIDN
ncbi:DUF6602 domain-containing protein [Klebsiella aerogenes]|uniref:DUF6602 domain-containing protein n=1 Tax=Klebsiella aerogenes TaxID=548 RepID=UPI0011314209|nr:DUF6602 domain-containing protein [Klebsiella aerogenes]TPW60940.1 hypothetical protein DL562_08505 [Klebsiella aerogenes]